ncbi:hypothetical protein BKA58DRAFT_334135 [Alternaria rosae]|uniref:uncharacterized protein n=1 Tax=Alternaria rosae TaxID=1187941 RepID=UPI001E8ECC40|nr:uncharacterized protein BKA58DRAFT_334135 [Alternaria rosae]KAH6875074.1 hypothetical protein BKA58DRAFT_334135 [Alternaria rosae]
MKLSLSLLAIVASTALAQNLASTNATDVRVAAEFDPEDIASAAEWTAAYEKGTRLACRLEANDKAAGRLWQDVRNPPSARSQWADVTLQKELKLWGWFTGKYEQELHCDFSDDKDPMHVNHLGTVFKSLGVNDKPREKGGDNMCYNLEHFDANAEDYDEDTMEQYYEVDGQEYRCTGAHVRFGINQRGGMIIGESFESPRVEAEANWGYSPKQAELPQLQRVSDIVMAFWLRDNPDPKNLKYYLVCNIINERTVALINAILKNHGLDKIPHWPGIVANMWDEEGPALLGSPLGGSLAYLLAQHKAELGIKHVTEVVIFRDDFAQDWSPYVQLLFRIKDVPNPAPDPALGAESGQALRLRSSVLDDGLKNRIHIHKIFPDTRALVIGGA